MVDSTQSSASNHASRRLTCVDPPFNTSSCVCKEPVNVIITRLYFSSSRHRRQSARSRSTEDPSGQRRQPSQTIRQGPDLRAPYTPPPPHATRSHSRLHSRGLRGTQLAHARVEAQHALVVDGRERRGAITSNHVVLCAGW